MRVRRLLIVIFAVVLMPQYVGAQNTTLELKILPINCIFETVNDGNNTLNYLTPEACGQFVNIPSFQKNYSTTRKSGSNPALITPIFRLSEPNNQLGYREDIYLNYFKKYFTDGQRFDLVAGQKVYFDVWVGQNFELHSITVKKIEKNYALITVASVPFNSKMHIQDTNQYDVTNDNHNDIEVVLHTIKGHVANIGFRQLANNSNQSIHQEASTNVLSKVLYALTSLAGVGLVGFILYKNREW
jgi:hypothetical protein